MLWETWCFCTIQINTVKLSRMSPLGSSIVCANKLIQILNLKVCERSTNREVELWDCRHGMSQLSRQPRGGDGESGTAEHKQHSKIGILSSVCDLASEINTACSMSVWKTALLEVFPLSSNGQVPRVWTCHIKWWWGKKCFVSCVWCIAATQMLLVCFF